MNAHVSGLLDVCKSKYSIDALNMSMSEWIIANMTLKGKPFGFEGREFQRRIVDDMHPNLHVVKLSQVGMALALDTPVPTPSGWTTMGDVSVGDRAYDEQGAPCVVEYVSPVYLDHDCYKVEFDDGTSIVADGGHRWFVQCHKAFGPAGMYQQSGRIPLHSEYARDGVISTDRLSAIYKEGNRNLFAIPNTKPIEGSDRPLPIDPYYLGLWLGDGHSYSTRLTGGKEDILVIKRELETRGLECRLLETKAEKVFDLKVDVPRDLAICPRGHDKQAEGTVGPWNRCRKCRDQDVAFRWRGEERQPSTPYDTMYSRLVRAGVLKAKHIPGEYLRASIEARRELLRGLMDTDGSITSKGRASFYNTNPDLISGVEELIASLGLKPRTRWRRASGGVRKNGDVINSRKLIAEVSFTAYADDDICRLPRKRERLRSKTVGRPTEALRRRIVSVEKISSVPVRCISVNSANHLFLAGRGMIPTHNTEVQMRKMAAFLQRNQGSNGIFTQPNQPMRDKLAKTRVKLMIDDNAVFNGESDRGSVRSSLLYQLGRSFMVISDCTEGSATGFPGDILFLDEVDLSDQQILALFGSRLQDSDWQITQSFSTPTHVSYGIDASFATTDQHEYLCRCPHCNHWQTPDFDESFVIIPGMPELSSFDEIEQEHIDLMDLDEAYVACEKCRRPLDLKDPALRQWVPTYPGRTSARGYRIRPFSTSRISIRYIVNELPKYKRRNFIRGWYNTVLGRAFTGGNERLTEEDIKACLTQGQSAVPDMAGRPISVGIDVGTTCHVILFDGADPETARPFSFQTVHADLLVAHVGMLKERYQIVTGGIDRHPQTVLANQVRDASGGKIWPIEYRGTKDLQPIKDLDGETVIHFQADRTTLLDRVATRVRKRNLPMGGYGTQKDVIIGHLRNMVRDEKPEEPARWLKLAPEDHYFHALGMGLTSMKIVSYLNSLVQADQRSVVILRGCQTGTTAGLLGAKNSVVRGPLG